MISATKQCDIEKENCNLEKSIEELISDTLQIPIDMVCDNLKYQSIKEWDSLTHVQLMLEIETKFELSISDNQLAELTSVSKIKEMVYDYVSPEDKKSNNKSIINDNQEFNKLNPIDIKIYRGLNGLNFDTTKITHIDGENGILQYRGYNIDELAEKSTYEETSFLLLNGYLPNENELINFKEQLLTSRNLAPGVIDLIYKLKDSHPMEMLRTVISFLSHLDSYKNENTIGATINKGIHLIAQIPIIISVFHSIRKNKDFLEPDKNFGHAKNFLYMLQGKAPADSIVNYVEKGLILQIDHGANASAFTARVVTSTQADFYSAITSAISAFSGSLHGGAAENVVKMIEEIGSPENVPSYIEESLSKNKPIMGFGHRIYRVEDPRAKHFAIIAKMISEDLGKFEYYEILERVTVEMQKFSKYGLNINVDFYMGLIYNLLGIPKDLLGAIFVVSRITGWLAQIVEQMENNILIRPNLHYVGDLNRKYESLDMRKNYLLEEELSLV